MTRPTVSIHNSQTDSIIDREMNDEEFKQYKIDQEAINAKNAELEAIAISKAALLTKLGITQEEAQLLLS